ncbi:MAG TPA: urease accessory UreF family protein [Nitrospiraceae bacterium]
MNTLSLVQGLRFVDSFFPSGGFAYSSGLEAAVQGGAVCNADDLSTYVEDLLRHGMGRREAVAVTLSHEAVSKGVLRTALAADSELDAMKIGRESREASRQMGRQVIRIAVEQMDGHLILHDFHAAVEVERTPCHLAVSLGLALAAAGWSREDAVAAYLYQTATGLMSAALKLLPIGQREGQRLLDGWIPLIAELSGQAQPESSMTSWSPVQDIYAMRHSRMESRLFRS